ERVREDVVKLPQRILLLRTASALVVVLGLMPLGAARLHLSLEAAAALGGFAVGLAYAFNVLRALVYRLVLDGLGRKVYAGQPLLYAARITRERIFVTANALGVVGSAVSVLFTYFVVETAKAKPTQSS